jgi:hypothetical protein
MKFIIKESKMEKMISNYINKLDYDVIVKKIKVYSVDSKVIYFIRKNNDGYADIRFETWDFKCYINSDLIDEINDLFSIDPDDYNIDAKDIVGEWVEDKLNLKQIPWHKLFVMSGWTKEVLNIESPEEEI